MFDKSASKFVSSSSASANSTSAAASSSSAAASCSSNAAFCARYSAYAGFGIDVVFPSSSVTVIVSGGATNELSSLEILLTLVEQVFTCSLQSETIPSWLLISVFNSDWISSVSTISFSSYVKSCWYN